MSTELVVVCVVVGGALGLLFMAWFALAACVQSGNDAEWERRIEVMKALGWTQWPAELPSANGDYPASSDSDGADISDGLESDHG